MVISHARHQKRKGLSLPYLVLPCPIAFGYIPSPLLLSLSNACYTYRISLAPAYSVEAVRAWLPVITFDDFLKQGIELHTLLHLQGVDHTEVRRADH